MAWRFPTFTREPAERREVRRNRSAIEVKDIVRTVDSLRKAGTRFRNDIVTGSGGKQIIVEDPSGNPTELFEPALPEARTGSA